MNLEPKNLRKHIINMAYTGSSVHIACAFSLVEICSVLYDKIMTFNNSNPDDPTRDILALSKGHGVMAIYACLKEMGVIEQEHFDKYFTDGSLLHGLGEPRVPGIEVLGGSLGHGLPVAIGMALGLKREGSNRQVYCIVGDGEINEGTIWEGLLFAGHHKLTNFTVIVDANGLQAMGEIDEILNLEPMGAKFKSFGFHTIECDGHNVKLLEDAFKDKTHEEVQKPKAIIARTMKGKGVSFMENDNIWHYTRLNPETLDKAMAELQEGEE
ncbi:MAG: transketolase [Halobacteriovorax sp.]|nr:transketolase [Halobacteriovorax sp.]|tara:strand:- start:68577 stop:69383 length:807 start_codon:yes stop_codon:yes gene_type:complete